MVSFQYHKLHRFYGKSPHQLLRSFASTHLRTTFDFFGRVQYKTSDTLYSVMLNVNHMSVLSPLVKAYFLYCSTVYREKKIWNNFLAENQSCFPDLVFLIHFRSAHFHDRECQKLVSHLIMVNDQKSFWWCFRLDQYSICPVKKKSKGVTNQSPAFTDFDQYMRTVKVERRPTASFSSLVMSVAQGVKVLYEWPPDPPFVTGMVLIF